ncbi:hypothetical protein Bca4012_063264 [Brassica carinata]
MEPSKYLWSFPKKVFLSLEIYLSPRPVLFVTKFFFFIQELFTWDQDETWSSLYLCRSENNENKQTIEENVWHQYHKVTTFTHDPRLQKWMDWMDINNLNSDCSNLKSAHRQVISYFVWDPKAKTWNPKFKDLKKIKGD